MRITDLVANLNELQERYGNLNVVIGGRGLATAFEEIEGLDAPTAGEVMPIAEEPARVKLSNGEELGHQVVMIYQ